MGRDANFQARELAGSERRGTTLALSPLSHVYSSRPSLYSPLETRPRSSTPPPPFNPGQRCKVDRCAHDSSRLVNHRRRGGSQASFSSARGLIELKTRRGKILKSTSLVAPTHRYLSRFYVKFLQFFKR